MEKYFVDLKQILKEQANWKHENFGIVANFIDGLGEKGIVEVGKNCAWEDLREKNEFTN